MSKLAGHQTARAVIEKMIEGERDPRVLAALGQGKMRNDKLTPLAEALTGMRFGPQHAHAAASLLRAIDLLEAELRDLHLRRPAPRPPDPLTPSRRHKPPPAADARPRSGPFFGLVEEVE